MLIKKIQTHLNQYNKGDNQQAPPTPKVDYIERVRIIPYDDGWPGSGKTVIDF